MGTLSSGHNRAILAYPIKPIGKNHNDTSQAMIRNAGMGTFCQLVTHESICFGLRPQLFQEHLLLFSSNFALGADLRFRACPKASADQVF
jgi:hypothetical protein